MHRELRDLHSFPARRSSDLAPRDQTGRGGGVTTRRSVESAGWPVTCESGGFVICGTRLTARLREPGLRGREILSLSRERVRVVGSAVTVAMPARPGPSVIAT